MGTVLDLQKKVSDDNDSKVLHLAMHGQKKTRAGRFTLDFNEANEGESVEPERLAEADVSGRTVLPECVVINACHGKEIAEMLKWEKHLVPWVVSWETAVHDQAAMTFSEAF